ncbi:MAG: 50S ribosomal protein L21 [Candidatus Sungbacteria bacterium]|uniref:Large ribosomal subunit protein bL21 n=1 Tax=Candidatus Sungiibacteriota bacterium TaxID=2750080 RepID=A0A9D6LQQ4_9BACT|nr:50S ribosomal protein L21 [Candidatus Sungbacteria bacterium]
MYAVIETGGKQYLVKENQKIRVEKLASDAGMIRFPKVLLVFDDKKMDLGAPIISEAAVEAEVLRQGRNKKIIVFKYHAKTRYRKKKGHRQPFTEVLIRKILRKN